MAWHLGTEGEEGPHNERLIQVSLQGPKYRSAGRVRLSSVHWETYLEAQASQECEAILEKTNFYAEPGGQIYDQGYLLKVNEFNVNLVCNHTLWYNRGGYVLHIGVVEEILRIGDDVACHMDVVRLQLTMKNHSATYALNLSLLKVLSQDTDHRGSLVVPEKLRFDFTNKATMTIEQVAEAERLTREVVKKNTLREGVQTGRRRPLRDSAPWSTKSTPIRCASSPSASPWKTSKPTQKASPEQKHP